MDKELELTKNEVLKLMEMLIKYRDFLDYNNSTLDNFDNEIKSCQTILDSLVSY